MNSRPSPARDSKPSQAWRRELEWDRKGIHVSSTLLAFWTFVMHEPLASIGLAIATLCVLAVDWARLGSRRWALWVYRKFRFVFRRDERHTLSGASVMMLGVTLTSAFFAAGPATAGILCLAWGDSAAALVGQAWSRWRYGRRLRASEASGAPVVWKRRRKTLAGTLGCFIVSMAMVALAIGPLPGLIVLGGAAAALMERWTPGRWDNLTMPLATAGILQYGLTWLG
jgi:dolichol kinase